MTKPHPPFWRDKPLSRYRRFRNWLQWPSMLEIFTISAILYGLYFENVMISWTFAILALAWARFAEENNGEKPEE